MARPWGAAPAEDRPGRGSGLVHPGQPVGEELCVWVCTAQPQARTPPARPPLASPETLPVILLKQTGQTVTPYTAVGQEAVR